MIPAGSISAMPPIGTTNVSLSGPSVSVYWTPRSKLPAHSISAVQMAGGPSVIGIVSSPAISDTSETVPPPAAIGTLIGIGPTQPFGKSDVCEFGIAMNVWLESGSEKLLTGTGWPVAGFVGTLNVGGDTGGTGASPAST